MKWKTISELDLQLKSGDKVFIHTAAANPQILLKKLCEEVVAKNLSHIQLYHLHLEGEAPHVSPELAGRITTNCFFVGANCRKAVQEGRANYIPIFLSEIPLAIKSGLFAFDLCLLHLSPFDERGMATLGPSVDISLSAAQSSKRVIAQVNKQMPTIFGDGIISETQVDVAVEVDVPLPDSKVAREAGSEIFENIGKNVASLIEEGSTLQMGIGAIPDAVLAQLTSHKNLGIHSEMISDGVIDLVEKGVIDNSKKMIVAGKIVASFAVGSKRLYQFLNGHKLCHFMTSDKVNAPTIIQKNPKVCAINSAIEIDITGQVCADSIGPKIFSGIGGQLDFMRGAALSQGGKPIMALSSRTPKGISKIVASLTPGAGVTTTRAHVHYVVTEYGIAFLYGKNLRERARELIKIAHPDDRENLEKNLMRYP
ncbi:MAG: acetyl-CoA hydrolase/transferase C-terminal domain-containing protein [Bacteriovoracaceae bacterium]|nr:acetyl-CoA hydrolase/transferase C-terminal domain-containing protein [Bacteriovoracaceae bacterium]